MIRNGIENVSKLKQQRIKHCRQAMVCPSIHPYPQVAPVRHLAPVQQHLEPPPINILRSPCWRLLAAQSQPGPTRSNHSFFPRTISQTGDLATSRPVRSPWQQKRHPAPRSCIYKLPSPQWCSVIAVWDRVSRQWSRAKRQ